MSRDSSERTRRQIVKRIGGLFLGGTVLGSGASGAAQAAGLLVTNGDVTIKGLDPGSPYSLRAVAVDSDGNVGTAPWTTVETRSEDDNCSERAAPVPDAHAPREEWRGPDTSPPRRSTRTSPSPAPPSRPLGQFVRQERAGEVSGPSEFPSEEVVVVDARDMPVPVACLRDD